MIDMHLMPCSKRFTAYRAEAPLLLFHFIYIGIGQSVCALTITVLMRYSSCFRISLSPREAAVSTLFWILQTPLS
jgi:hypothetical protein